MSYELRLKKLKDSWLIIQDMRDLRAKNRKIMQKASKEVRRLSQEIPRKLNEFNNIMV